MSEEQNFLKNKQRLHKDYLDVMNKVELFINVRNIHADEAEDMRQELLDTLLMAQKENKPVRQIVGNDLELFCKRYTEHFNWLERLRNFPERIYSFMWMVFIIEMVTLLLELGEKDFSIWSYQSDISGYMVGLVGGMVLLTIWNLLIRRLMFRYQFVSITLHNIVFILTIVLLAGISIRWTDIISAPIWVMVTVSGAYIAGYRFNIMGQRYGKFGTIKKRSVSGIPEETTFWEMAAYANIDGLPERILKRIEKTNELRLRHNEEPLTEKECVDSYIAKMYRDKRLQVYWKCIFIGMAAIMVLLVAFTSTATDTIIFTVIILAIEIPIYRFFAKSSVVISSEIAFLEHLEVSGVSISDYRMWSEEKRQSIR